MIELLTIFTDQCPTKEASKITNDKIFNIMESAMPYSQKRHMVLQSFDPMDGTIADLVEFCERMEATEEAPKNKSKKFKATKNSNKM